MNFAASTASKSRPLGQLSSQNGISLSDNDEDDFQTVADKIHNDNFNFKLKVHMLNKLLDENAGTAAADSKVKEDLRSMERKIELSQRRYDRLVRNRRRQKNRVDKGYGTRSGYDGLSKISRNNNIIGKANKISGNQNDDGMSFSAVEREQKDVEQRFRDRFGLRLLLPTSTYDQKTAPIIAPTQKSAPSPVAPKFSTLFGGFGNGGGEKLKTGRIEELLSSPQSPQVSGKTLWDAKKVTRFSDSNGPTISPPRTPPGVRRFGNNTDQMNFNNTNNIHTNGIVPKFDNLSLTDSDDPFSITEAQNSDDNYRPGNTGIGVRSQGIWISDAEYEEFRQLKLLKARQTRKIEEQESEIYRLKTELRTKESMSNNNYFSNHLNQTTNRVDFFSNLRRQKNIQPDPENVNSNRNKTIKGLTWVYDSFKSIQGVPPDLLSTLQDCILDITYNFGRDNLPQIPPVQSSTLAKAQSIESITESQQLAVYQYELNRTKQRLSDLAFANEIKSRQIEVYQAANKTRIQLMRSLGLILPTEGDKSTNHSNQLYGNNYNWYSYRNKLLLTNAERQKLQEKFRVAIYYVIAARRFVQRLDDKMVEKHRLRQRLVELGRNGGGNSRTIGQVESTNNLLRF